MASRRLASRRPLAGGARSVGDAESGERLLIRHAGLLQSLLPLELAQCPLGHRSELAVEVSHVETLLLQRLLDLPDLALARVICRALTALFIGIFIRQLPAALRLSLLRLRLLLCLLRLWLRLGPLLCLLLRRLLRLRLLLCLLLRRLLRLRLLLCLLLPRRGRLGGLRRRLPARGGGGGGRGGGLRLRGGGRWWVGEGVRARSRRRG